jgi:hypothetical protein
MHLSNDGGLSAILRLGDYFILRADHNGVSAEYSPDGERSAPVNGAFAAIGGFVRVWTPSEAQEVMKEKGYDAEAFLLREARRERKGGISATMGKSRVEPLEKLKDKVQRMLVAFAQEYSTVDAPYWRGFMPDFHRDIVSKFYPGPLDPAMRGVILELDKGVEGVWVSQEGKGYQFTHITVDWQMLAGGSS